MRINELLHFINQNIWVCKSCEKTHQDQLLQKLIRSAKLEANKNYITHAQKTILAMSEESATLISLMQFLRLFFRSSQVFISFWTRFTEKTHPPVSHHKCVWCLISALALMLPATARTNGMLWRWSTARRTCGSLSLLILPVFWDGGNSLKPHVD